MNDTDRQELRYRLAEKVLGWVEGANFQVDEQGLWVLDPDPPLGLIQWTPDLPTPQGLYQCFGPGGVVERMKGIGWMLRLNIYSLLYEASFYSYKTKQGSWPMTDNFSPALATCLAADKAMEEK